MKLWIFGDSFSAKRQQDLHDYKILWHEELGKRLQADVVYKSNFGLSNDYIYKELLENIQNIQNDDYVLIQYTEKNRQYFFAEHPDCGNYHALCNMSDSQILQLGMDKKVKNAVKEYIKYLQNDDADNIRYHQLLLATGGLFQEITTNNIRLFSGFEKVNGVKGCLNNISWNEYKNKQQHFTADQIDLRQNHISEANHLILANKLSYWFTEPGKMLDLEQGFEHSFIGD